jgi:membrane protein
MMDTEVQQAESTAESPLVSDVISPKQKAEEAHLSYYRRSKGHLRARAIPTLKYLAETEVHTYAFSVAANAILSFVPFLVLMLTIIRTVFHSKPMENVVYQLLNSYLPSNQNFIVGSLQKIVRSHHGFELMSLIMLFISSTGVFEPLEVALNSVWGIKANRSYLKNQLISVGLALGCGALAMISVAMTAGNQLIVQEFFGHHPDNFIFNFVFSGASWVVSFIIMKIFAMFATISIFFLIYWLLPNGKVKALQVFPAAVVAGILLEIAKYIYIAALPLLDFQESYGPFSVSVTLIFWAFIAGMLMLGGAYLSAAERENGAA